MATRSDLLPNISTLEIGTQAATIALPGIKFPRHSKIRSASYINQAALAADNVNFLQVQILDSTGAVIGQLDTRAANQGALVANVPKDLVLTPSAQCPASPHGELDVAPAGAPGDYVTLNVVKNGTGVPTLGQLQIEWYPA